MILHYRGNCVLFDARRIVGPDDFGGFWRACNATYDADLDMTTIDYMSVPPSLWPKETQLARSSWQARKDERLLRLALAGHQRSLDQLVSAASEEALLKQRMALRNPGSDPYIPKPWKK